MQTLLTAAKVVSILGVAAGVFLFSGTHDWSNFAPTAGAASGGVSGFGAAMFAALWAYSGWQFLPMAASEVQQPDRNLPRAIIGGTLLVLAIYMLINVAYLYALPFWQVATANSTAYPEAPSVAARAVQTFLGTKAAPIAALIFLVSSVGALNGTILARARVPYAAARDGLFFASFGKLSPHSRVPRDLHRAGQHLGGAAGRHRAPSISSPTWRCCRTPSSGPRWCCRSSCCGARCPDAPRPYRVLGYPFVPVLFVLVMCWIVVNAFMTNPVESVATLALILFGLPLYPLFRARVARQEPPPCDSG